MPGHKKAAHHHKPLTEKSVEQLRKLASRHGVPQSKDGEKFDKAQLVRRLHAKHVK